MPHPDDAPPITRGVVLRGFGLLVAIALGALAAWLIITSTSQRGLQLGVIAGLWAALIGAFALFGARRPVHYSEPAEPATGTALELRGAQAELDRAEEAAARRAHELRLEQLLRREVQGAVAREVAALRDEIADLRSELLEKVGGQLRLERIETTRVIGSDLEALQHELRELKAAAERESAALALRRSRLADTGPLRQIVETARVRPVSRETAEVEADVQPARTSPLPETPPPAPAPPPAFATPPSTATPPSFAPAPSFGGSSVFGTSQPPPPAPSPPVPPSAPPVPPSPAAQRPGQPPPPVAPPAPATEPDDIAPARRPAPTLPGDDFAALPRIRPFTDFALDPIEESHDYTGRRRRVEDTDPGLGRHSRSGEPAGRRHRREDEDEDEDTPDDVLARLLSRQSRR